MAGRNPLTEGGVCIRAREWASLRLDDELSPLEVELLERHLEVCEDCRAFDSDVRWATDVLRLTIAERPSRRVSIPTRPARRLSTGPRRAAVAAVAALALGVLVGFVAGPGSTEPVSPPQVSLLDVEIDLPRAKVPVPDPAPAPLPHPPKGVI